LLTKIGANGFTDTTDKREIHKLPQWEKLHVFDEYFSKWSRVVYLDAGLRVLDDVKYLLELDCTNRILAPRDGKLHQPNEFKCQLSNDNSEIITNMRAEFGDHMFKSDYMLNCMWVYDTSILRLCDKAQLIEAMNTYTCCKTNEMGIMNILFHFKYNLWEPMPVKSSNNKFLFDWCELNQTHKTTWRDYCFIKYPVSISFDDT
jgi:lipopolysaccharide biosynthesis glycosyltransferase